MSMSVTQRICAVLAAAMLISGTALAAKAPVKKPVTKKPTTNRATLGTTQLKSDYNNPRFGETFTLGKRSPINITLNSAEYTTARQFIGTDMHTVDAGQKFLVLHYTLHNPNKADYGLSWHTVEIFGVDANDKNWRFITNVAIEGTGERCNMSLKPGQKTRVYTFIKLPAQGALPKLVIESPDKLVLRYNLLAKDAKGNYVNPVKPLPAPIADPTDQTGGTALEKVPAEMGIYYPMYDYDAKVDSVTFSNAAIRGKAPKAGQRYMVAVVTAKNANKRDSGFYWNTIDAKAFNQDGGEIKLTGEALFASSDEPARGSVSPGQEMRARYVFTLPADLQPKSLAIRSGGNGRSYVYDLSAVK